MKCPKCGSPDGALRVSRCRGYTYQRWRCRPCEKARNNARYAGLDQARKAARLADKRRRARTRGRWRPESAHMEERIAAKIQRDAFRAMLREWRSHTRIPIGADIMAIARAQAERTGEPYKAVLWRTRYQRDPHFKAREIERLHRQKLRRHSLREFTSDGTLHGKAIQALFATARRCTYCRQVFRSGREKTLDHVVPLSKGGAHSILNVVIACRPCNTRKGGKTWLAA